MNNLITEGWEEFTLTCGICKGTFSELADPSRVARHWAGAMVQDVWTEANDDYREFMIAVRAKFSNPNDNMGLFTNNGMDPIWVCGAKHNDCWSKVFSDDCFEDEEE